MSHINGLGNAGNAAAYAANAAEQNNVGPQGREGLQANTLTQRPPPPPPPKIAWTPSPADLAVLSSAKAYPQRTAADVPKPMTPPQTAELPVPPPKIPKQQAAEQDYNAGARNSLTSEYSAQTDFSLNLGSTRESAMTDDTPPPLPPKFHGTGQRNSYDARGSMYSSGSRHSAMEAYKPAPTDAELEALEIPGTDEPGYTDDLDFKMRHYEKMQEVYDFGMTEGRMVDVKTPDVAAREASEREAENRELERTPKPKSLAYEVTVLFLTLARIFTRGS